MATPTTTNKAKTVDQAIDYSSDGGAAQYALGVNNKALEKLTTQKDIVVENLDSTGNILWYHGHPIHPDRLKSQYGIGE